MKRPYYFRKDGARCVRELPDPESFLMDGIRYGDALTPLTPAYWMSQWWSQDKTHRLPVATRVDQVELVEGVVFCLLGGYGITYEMNDAAYQACAAAGLISVREIAASRWEAVLGNPLLVQGRARKYRFPRQKARYLAAAMLRLGGLDVSTTGGRALRDELTTLGGIGPKTASWIVRNVTRSDDVAILDIHIYRAGRIMGLFDESETVERCYARLEEKFIAFAQALGVPAAELDLLIWSQMRDYGAYAREIFDALPARRTPATTLRA